MCIPLSFYVIRRRFALSLPPVYLTSSFFIASLMLLALYLPTFPVPITSSNALPSLPPPLPSPLLYRALPYPYLIPPYPTSSLSYPTLPTLAYPTLLPSYPRYRTVPYSYPTPTPTLCYPTLSLPHPIATPGARTHTAWFSGARSFPWDCCKNRTRFVFDLGSRRNGSHRRSLWNRL